MIIIRDYKELLLSEKMRKSIVSLKINSQKKKAYTNILFPNWIAIIYALSFQKYKNIDLQLDFLNC